jgi:hypothetical protein
MGIYFTRLKEQPKPNSSIGLLQRNLYSVSLSKIRELHGAFKSICDYFAISLTEYEQIFNVGDASFNVWDTDRNGIIDAFELFSGIILFADSRTEDKLKCKTYSVLFDLFDFNESQSITKKELQFMIYCCISAAFKIHYLADEISHRAIEELVNKTFIKDSRVTLKELMQFMSVSEEINSFLQFFKIRGISVPKPATGKDIFLPIRNLHLPSNVMSHSRQLKRLDELLGPKLEESMVQWLGAVLAPLSAQLDKKQSSRGKVSLEWVHGIRTEDTRHNIKCVNGQEILLYYIASIVVVYYPMLLKQRHYIEHENEVVSLAVGIEDIACSGELADHPKIHVWKISTLENLEVLTGVHQGAIPLLSFCHYDQHIISCSIYTLVIYEWKTRSILISTHHNQPIVDLALLPRTDITASTNFIVACEEEFTLYTINEDELNVATCALEASLTKSPITCTIGQRIVSENLKDEKSYLILTGHEDGNVLVWAHLEFQRVLATYEGTIAAIEKAQDNFAIGTSHGYIYLWDSELEKAFKVIELSMLPFKLMSFEVSSLYYENKKLFVSTTAGDLLEIKQIKEAQKYIVTYI